jgi:hypothetical protein
VLFAEAGKDFVDVLISFLTLPLGTIARLVAKKCHMGPLKIASLSSLYDANFSGPISHFGIEVKTNTDAPEEETNENNHIARSSS